MFGFLFFSPFHSHKLSPLVRTLLKLHLCGFAMFSQHRNTHSSQAFVRKNLIAEGWDFLKRCRPNGPDTEISLHRCLAPPPELLPRFALWTPSCKLNIPCKAAPVYHPANVPPFCLSSVFPGGPTMTCVSGGFSCREMGWGEGARLASLLSKVKGFTGVRRTFCASFSFSVHRLLRSVDSSHAGEIKPTKRLGWYRGFKTKLPSTIQIRGRQAKKIKKVSFKVKVFIYPKHRCSCWL